MTKKGNTFITVKVDINEPLEKVWSCWTEPDHIVKWNFASDDWHCPRAENDLHSGGLYSWRMEAKDGSMGFDFWGRYTLVDPFKELRSELGDGRKVEVKFKSAGDRTTVEETFEAETENTAELQKAGWQAILNNLKKHTESVK